MRADRSRVFFVACLWGGASVGVFLIWYLTRDLRDLPDALWRVYYASTVAMNLAATAAILGVAWLLTDLRQWRRRVAELLLAGMTTGLVIGLFELPAVAFGHDYGITFGTHANDTWLQLAQGVNRRDDELIHIHHPHTRYQGEVVGNLTWIGLPARPPYQVDVQYDRNGFRNSTDLDRAAVVAIGDSFLEGAETAEGDLVTTLVAKRLGVPVANLGQSNYGPQQELAVLRRFGLPLAPRTVVWFFFGGNDLSDIDAYEWRRSHIEEFLSPPRDRRSFVRNALVALARRTTPPRRTESPAAERHVFTYRTATGAIERMYVDAEEGPVEPRLWQAASAILGEAHARTQAAGADFVVAFIPRKLRVYDGFIEAAPGSYARTWKSNDLPSMLGDWCRDNSVGYIDMTQPLRAAVAVGQSVYLPDDVHWNAAGHAVAAAAVAEVVASRWVSRTGTERP
jgi:lysophospholipase L1-like esterase